MYKVFKGGKELNKVRYWINTIKARVPDPIFLFVGTHLDVFNEMLEDYKEFVAKMNKHLPELDPRDIIGVSCDGENVEALAERLKQKALELQIINEPFPQMYLDLKQKLDELAKGKDYPIASWEVVEEKAGSCNIVQQSELLRALEFLHILGFALHFRNDKVCFYF